MAAPSSHHSMGYFSVVFVKTKIFYGPFNFCMGHLHRITKLYASNGPWPLPFPITDSKKGYGCQNMRDYKILPTQIIVKEQLFYCCSTFNSHCRVFDNEHNSYPKMSVKWPKPCSLSGTLCLCHF